MAGAVDPRKLDRLFPEENIMWEAFRNFGDTVGNLASRGVKLDSNR
jgi:hypothetical protein